jgi:hypothetical protein
MGESSRGVRGELTPLNWLRLITDFDIAPPRRDVCQWREPACGRWGLTAGKARGELVAIGAARRIPIIVCKLMWQCFVALTGNGIGSMTQECWWSGKTYHMVIRHSLSTSLCSNVFRIVVYFLERLIRPGPHRKISLSNLPSGEFRLRSRSSIFLRIEPTSSRKNLHSALG